MHHLTLRSRHRLPPLIIYDSGRFLDIKIEDAGLDERLPLFLLVQLDFLHFLNEFVFDYVQMVGYLVGFAYPVEVLAEHVALDDLLLV